MSPAGRGAQEKGQPTNDRPRADTVAALRVYQSELAGVGLTLCTADALVLSADDGNRSSSGRGPVALQARTWTC